MQLSHEAFASWLEGYVSAWRGRDGQVIGALFSPAATYSYRAGRHVVEGRDAIVASWLEDEDDGRWEARYEPLAIEADVHVARGYSRYFREDGSLWHEYSNIFVCRFDDAGQCLEFVEWWMRTYDGDQAAPEAP
jgi:hypothetical protein